MSFGSVLWDQSAFDITNTDKLDTEVSTGLGAAYSTYAAADFSASTNWNVDSISIYMVGKDSRPDFVAPLVTGARVSVWAKTGSAPLTSNDPTVGAIHAVTITDVDSTTRKVTVSGLNLAVLAGSYWVSVTPIISSFSTSSQRGDIRFTAKGTKWGESSYLRNPSNAFGSGTDWATSPVQGIPNDADIAFKIEGSAVPEPATMAVLGLGFVALVRKRRSK